LVGGRLAPRVELHSRSECSTKRLHSRSECFTLARPLESLRSSWGFAMNVISHFDQLVALRLVLVPIAKQRTLALPDAQQDAELIKPNHGNPQKNHALRVRRRQEDHGEDGHREKRDAPIVAIGLTR